MRKKQLLHADDFFSFLLLLLLLTGISALKKDFIFLASKVLIISPNS